jgi:Arc/MetJ family transcription regulator
MTDRPRHGVHVTVDAALIEQGLTATGLKTHRELVNFALRELVRRENQKKLLELKGQVQWEGNLTAMRGGVADDPG